MRTRAATARPLLDGAVGWLLAQRRSFENGAYFPIYFGEGIEPGPGRPSRRYGDPGIAAALLVASRAVVEPARDRILRLSSRATADVPTCSMCSVEHATAALAWSASYPDLGMLLVQGDRRWKCPGREM